MDRAALGWGFLSYAMWGFFPVFWKSLADRSTLEVLSHRIIWSFVFYAVIFYFTFKKSNWFSAFRQLSYRDWMLSIGAALLLTINWGLYIYAVNSGHILQSSLAYFINPLLNVCVGVFFFKETFPRLLKWAVGFAALGVILKMFGNSGVPWLALVLASTFCTYGVLKKLLKIPVASSSVLESGVVVLPAVVGLLWWMNLQQIPAPEPRHWMLFVLGGIVTGLPLFLFSFAAQKVPYSIMGMMQFIAPTLQFLVGVHLYHEPFSRQDFWTFSLIWLGMACYLFHQARQFMRAKRTFTF